MRMCIKAHMCNSTKWRPSHPEMLVELSVLLSDGCDKSVCNKGLSTIVYEDDWYVNHSLQTNQFVGKPVEEEEMYNSNGVQVKIKKSSNLKRRNIGIANLHKKYRRQDRDPGWLDHILAR